MQNLVKTMNLQTQLKEIEKQIESLITAIMNGLNFQSIELKIKQLENEKSILTEKNTFIGNTPNKTNKSRRCKTFYLLFYEQRLFQS